MCDMTVRDVSEQEQDVSECGHGMTPLPVIPEGSIDVDGVRSSSSDNKSRVRFI